GTGYVYQGVIATVDPSFSDELKMLLQWADETAKIKVMANADTPDAAQKALNYGAMGIGLCRTERMFNAPDRLPIVVEMILANTEEERSVALNQLLPIQRQDFKDILTTMAPRPVTVRLLDPPIHEFLPTEEELREELVHLRHLKDTASGVNNLFNSLRLLHAHDENTKSTLPFNEKGVELIAQAIVKKAQILYKVHHSY